MKITANKRDEALRRKAEYDARMDAYTKDRDERSRKHREADYAITGPIKESIEKDLEQFDLLNFQVDASKGYNWAKRDEIAPEYYVEVRIRCNDWHRGDNDALGWSFEVKIDKDGNVVKETGSWSGLQATTPEQINSLKQTVAAIELLNSYDWKEIILKDFPDYEQFYEGAIEQPEHQNMNQAITEGTLEDLIGEPAIVKIYGWGEDFRSRYYWAYMVGQTEKQWRMRLIDNYVISALQQDEFEDDQERNTYRESVKRVVTSDESWRTVRARKSSISITDIENPEIIYLSELGVNI